MKKIFYLISICFILCLSVKAGVWLRNQSLKQGEAIKITGLLYKTSKGESFLNECSLNFENKSYKFYKNIVDWQEYIGSDKKNGFEYIARIPTTPLSADGTQAMVLKCPVGEESFNIDLKKGEFPLQKIKLSPSKSSLTATKKELQAISKTLQTKSESRLWKEYEKWSPPTSAPVSSVYGLRRSYNGVLEKDYFHKGLDYAAKAGSLVKSPADGKVILTGREKEGFSIHGNCVGIDHGQSVITIYLHLSEISVKEGSLIKKGDVIGKVGDSGIATGPHLHFGLYVGGQSVNPNPWFEAAQI